MTFKDLDEAYRVCLLLQSEKDALFHKVAAHEIIIESLMRTHPDFSQFQLKLTSLLEQNLASVFSQFPQADQEQIRKNVEALQAAPEHRTPIAPLSDLFGKP